MSAAQAASLRRLRREGRNLAPFRLWVVAIVLLVAVTSHPTMGASGRHLVLSACVIVFAVEMLGWPLLRSASPLGRAGELALMGASAVAISWLQPNGLSELPASAVVFTAGVALAPRVALAVGGAVTVGIAAVLAATHGGGAASVAAATLLCAVLGLTGALLRRYRLSQDRTELLLAELEDARDDQARAAAAQERAEIARELHDVLAHSLSGLSIQVETARKLASATGAAGELRDVLDAAAVLAKQGVVEARRAVGSLRRENGLGLEQLPDLIETFRRDFELDVTYTVDGASRPLPPELGLALYRLTGEALTNVARHATGATTRVDLSFTAGEVRLAVRNDGGVPGELAAQGSGWGLAGIRERIKRLGGDLQAGPTETGWTVVASAPS